MIQRPPTFPLFPYTTLFRSVGGAAPRLPAEGAAERRHRGRGRGAGPLGAPAARAGCAGRVRDRKSTRLNSSHVEISYAVFCMKNKINFFRLGVFPIVVEQTE